MQFKIKVISIRKNGTRFVKNIHEKIVSFKGNRLKTNEKFASNLKI
jgi:hypothetical protein